MFICVTKQLFLQRDAHNLNKLIDKVYNAMKGLKYCLYYNGGTWARGIKKVLILDPELVVKVTMTDFDHFVDNQFFSQEYTDVS